MIDRKGKWCYHPTSCALWLGIYFAFVATALSGEPWWKF